MDNIDIRKGTSQDTDAIVSFQVAMARETELKNLTPETVAKGVSAVFSDNSKGFYVVAVSDDKVVGSLLVTSEWSDWRNKEFWWIQSVYVVPEYRRQGVFSGLFNFTQEEAVSNGNVCFIRLYVEQANEAAKKTYESLGLRHSGYTVLEKEIN